MQLLFVADKWQIIEGHSLGRRNVKDVILVAKHESRANIKVVNMLRACTVFIMHILSNGTVAALLRCAQFKVVADYAVLMCQRYECFTTTTTKKETLAFYLFYFRCLKATELVFVYCR